MIRWFSHRSFCDECESRYQSVGAWLDTRLVLDATDAACRRFIPHAPDDAQYEGDPGPLLRWYGDFEGLLFVVECHASLSAGSVSIVLPDPAKLVFRNLLSMMSHLDESGLFSLGPCVWVQGERAGALCAVAHTDGHGIKWEIYRARERVDAEAMLAFLSSHAPSRTYRIDFAEDAHAVWVVDRISDQTNVSTVARYGDRATTERAAREFSLREGVPFKARREDAIGAGLAFRHGEIVAS